MNSLRDLLQSLTNGHVFRDPTISERNADSIHTRTLELGEQAQCFDVGEWDQIAELNVVPGLCVMPYPVCWLEGSIESGNGERRGRFGLLVVEQARDVYELVCYMFHDGRYAVMFGARVLSLQEGTCQLTSAEPDVIEAAQRAVFALRAFCSAINCCNVTRTEHPPSEKLQKARAKRGKAPLFSYWTLDLDIGKSRDVGADLGGTHAAPRVHLRRGHPRQYAPGKYCWVQPCIVGNKAAGMVHKDYAVRGVPA